MPVGHCTIELKHPAKPFWETYIKLMQLGFVWTVFFISFARWLGLIGS